MKDDEGASKRELTEFLTGLLRRIVSSRRWWLLPVWLLLAAIGLVILLAGGPNILPVLYIAF